MTAPVSERSLSRLTREGLGVPGLRERYELHRDLTIEKVNALLLPAMRRHGIDMWIVLDREYHPDPMAREIGGRGGVRNAHVFYDDGEKLEKIVIFSHEHREDLVAKLYDEMIMYGYTPEGLKPHLAEAVRKRNPKRIGLNMSPTLPMADGLSVELKRYLDDAIGPELAAREVSAELVVRDFRSIRLPEETALYRTLVEWTAAWEVEGLSRAAITPGVTTADDVHWWYRERALELGLEVCSFTPGLRIIRDGRHLPTNDSKEPILPGDTLSIDAGLQFIGYHTDLKRMAYVLHPGETAPPPGLRKAYQDAKRVTDVLCQNIRPGRLGHEVWEMTTNWAAENGYMVGFAMGIGGKAKDTDPEVGVYCHSVGTDVHDIGARVAENNPHAFGNRVQYELAENTWISVELHVSTPVPEWNGKTVKITIEETALITQDGPQFLVPRQEDWLLIPS